MSALITVAETAERLRVSPDLVRDLGTRGEITIVHIGRRRVVVADTVDAYVARQIDAAVRRHPARLAGPVGRPVRGVRRYA